jgi:hypothetical protein
MYSNTLLERLYRAGKSEFKFTFEPLCIKAAGLIEA